MVGILKIEVMHPSAVTVTVIGRCLDIEGRDMVPRERGLATLSGTEDPDNPVAPEVIVRSGPGIRFVPCAIREI